MTASFDSFFYFSSTYFFSSFFIFSLLLIACVILFRFDILISNLNISLFYYTFSLPLFITRSFILCLFVCFHLNFHFVFINQSSDKPPDKPRPTPPPPPPERLIYESIHMYIYLYTYIFSVHRDRLLRLRLSKCFCLVFKANQFAVCFPSLSLSRSVTIFPKFEYDINAINSRLCKSAVNIYKVYICSCICICCRCFFAPFCFLALFTRESPKLFDL